MNTTIPQNNETDIHKDVEKLTPEQFRQVRTYISNLRNRDATRLRRRIQFLATDAEFNAFRTIALREGLSMSDLMRKYLKCVHPESATLTARLKKQQLEQQKLLGSLIASESIDYTRLADSLAQLEKTTATLIRIMEERR